MKHYNLTPQETPFYCVPSVLQAVLRRRGTEMTQQKIASRLTPANKMFRMNDERITRFLQEQGFEYQPFYWNTTPFNEPDSLLEDMSKHEGIIGINEHSFLLEEFKDPKIILADPKDARIIERDIEGTLREMQRTQGILGLLKYQRK